VTISGSSPSDPVRTRPGDAPAPAEASEAFGALVSRIEYPMLIVTVAVGSERSGCLVGFATQASIDPPRLLVFLSKRNRTIEVARRATTLAVHFLHENNAELAALFGEETGDRTDKFAQCRWSEGPGGTPVLWGVAGWVAGPILGRFDTGDHVGHLIAVAHGVTEHPGPQLGFQAVRDLEAGHPA